MDPLTILAGASLVNTALNYNSAGDAAQAQADASARAAQISMDQYNQSRNDLSPYRDVATGNTAEYQQHQGNIESLVDDFMAQERGAINAYMPGATRDDVRREAYS